MGHPSRFYTGRPQLCLPSLSRPKTMSPVPSWDPWVLYPDLKPPALELPIILWLWILFPLLTFGVPGSPGSGMLPLVLVLFCPQLQCVYSRVGVEVLYSSSSSKLLEASRSHKLWNCELITSENCDDYLQFCQMTTAHNFFQPWEEFLNWKK